MMTNAHIEQEILCNTLLPGQFCLPGAKVFIEEMA